MVDDCPTGITNMASQASNEKKKIQWDKIKNRYGPLTHTPSVHRQKHGQNGTVFDWVPFCKDILHAFLTPFTQSNTQQAHFWVSVYVCM